MARRAFKLAAAAGLAATSLLASGCDVSPYAASVNSHVIKQTALYAELRAWAGNSAYVTAFDSASQSSSGLTVAGDAPGTYSTAWVASILDSMIDASAVHQQLLATGAAVSPAMLAAARAVREISQIGWYQFPPAFRDTLVERLAEEATISTASVDPRILQLAYREYSKYFFTQVCTVEAAAFSAAQAQTLVGDGVLGGAPECYSQAQLEAQPAAFRSAVLDTAVDTVGAPVQTSYGYRVFKVTSRAALAFGPEVEKALSVVIHQAEGVPDPTVLSLLAKDRVKVNPAYGSWRGDHVVPPPVPLASQQ